MVTSVVHELRINVFKAKKAEKEGSRLREVSLPAEELQVRRPKGRNVPAGLQEEQGWREACWEGQ